MHNYYIIGTVIISTIAFLVSIYVAISQKRFNKNSVRPICDISCIDYTNHIRIELINNGLGVMIIEKVQFKDIDDRTKSSITNFLPENMQLKHEFQSELFFIIKIFNKINNEINN